MSFGVEFDKRAEVQLALCGLSDAVIDELDRLFDTELSQSPTQHLRSVGNTLQYACRVVEHSSLPILHFFLFRVRYRMDEEGLIIWDCHHFPMRA